MGSDTTFSGKERVGRITIERFRRSIRLRWTLRGKTYCLTVGKDFKQTIKIARAKAQSIDSDITLDRFDTTLERYGKIKPQDDVSEIQADHLTARQLWDEFVADKIPHLKAKSQEEYERFSILLDKLGDRFSYEALDTKNALLSITTTDQTRRVLTYLSASCDWGIKHGKIANNPFRGIAGELPKRQSLTDPSPNAFTAEEREAVIQAFKSSDCPGAIYSHYAPIVEFWFLTGCRPSEAVGLTWDKISQECTKILFDGSIQTLADGSQVWSQGSKNNKSRIIATSARVQLLLKSIKPDHASNQLVFPSPTGKPINYVNFSKRAWRAIVDLIKPDTTPYNCRDTFITLQLQHGVPSAVISKWCDTSTQMIDKNYADKIKLSLIVPFD